MSDDLKALLLVLLLIVGAMWWQQLNPANDGGGCYDGDTEVVCP